MARKEEKHFFTVDEALEIIQDDAGSVVCPDDSSDEDDLIHHENIDDSSDSDYRLPSSERLVCLINVLFIDLLVSNFQSIYSKKLSLVKMFLCALQIGHILYIFMHSK